MSALLALGAAAATTGVLVHGLVGHRWMTAQLTDLPPSQLFGDADVGRRVFLVTWHVVTALFAATAVALAVLAVDGSRPRALLLFLCGLYTAVLLLGLVSVGRRPAAVLRPVPPVFALCMTTVALTTGLAAR